MWAYGVSICFSTQTYHQIEDNKGQKSCHNKFLEVSRKASSMQHVQLAISPTKTIHACIYLACFLPARPPLTMFFCRFFSWYIGSWLGDSLGEANIGCFSSDIMPYKFNEGAWLIKLFTYANRPSE